MGNSKEAEKNIKEIIESDLSSSTKDDLKKEEPVNVVLSEEEETRLRSKKPENKTPKEDEKKPKMKIPLIIRILNGFHMCLISICLFVAINSFFEFLNIKNMESLEIDTSKEIGKIIICSILVVFFAYTKMILMEHFDSE